MVCGHQFAGGSSRGEAAAAALPRGGVPEIKLSLPIAIGLLAVFLLVGGGLTYFGLAQTDRIAVPTSVPSVTPSPSITPTETPETPTPTHTPVATHTPSPYTVQQGDTCGSIATIFRINIQSLILANALDANCNLSVGTVLQIPAPTFTPTPEATSTLTNEEATRAACETEEYVVQADDTMSLIAQVYGVPLEAILEWNGLVSDVAFLGQRLEIPICERAFVNFGAATVTPTIAPPYPAPELLLPVDGEPFDAVSNSVTLQWSSVGTLRNNEYYQVTVVDVTGGQNRQLVEEVKDTKFIVPASFRANDGRPHVYRWFVVPVAQIGVDNDGLPVYVTGGPMSDTRVFTWSGEAGAAATPTP